MAPPWLMPPVFSRKGSGTSRASLYRGQIAPMPAWLSSGDEVFAEYTSKIKGEGLSSKNIGSEKLIWED
uniref:Uncharacterized protein n=1 Tax=Oryza meridionalis TaxID=40149 RepID=A0A0E0EM62_9ORYZ